MRLTPEQENILEGKQGKTRQKAIRLLIDLGKAANAEKLVPVTSAHVSGVSPLTGGDGLIQFLEDLVSDSDGTAVVDTTLNSAGCDRSRFEEMDIPAKDYVEKQQMILDAYEKLGIELSLSCTPYDNILEKGNASWAESNAVCFANSYSKLRTNRESGLSALATSLSGFTPEYGLLLDENRVPNIKVNVLCELNEPVDYSILGDWIGKQIDPKWKLDFGPIPHIYGIDKFDFESKKALTAASANYGSALLFVDSFTKEPSDTKYQAEINFDYSDLEERYEDLAPKTEVDLVTIGCPQASIEEIERTAGFVKGKRIPGKRLWVFTSSVNFDEANEKGYVETIEKAGGMVLRETCPEVVHYNHKKVKHILTNSMKAEHYLKSGLNSINTSVSRLSECIKHAENKELITRETVKEIKIKSKNLVSSKTLKTDILEISGKGLESQKEWDITGEALVTDVPITFLGFVNRETGTIEEEGHPLDGVSMANKILIFPKGSGSTVAPYVLLGLFYNGNGPKAIINTDLDQQTIPACSLLAVPYAHSFEKNPCTEINSKDKINLTLKNGRVTLGIVKRHEY
ncbi:MAG: aconitase X [Candidatus Poseidoniales archaeon]|tara:strand:- start:94 stop:1809 length:1716 start_codon:yes stop_codon:yes gene_type:complete